MKLSLRSPFVWISATLLSGLMYFFAFHFFPQTFPIVHLAITMDLEQALHKADELAEQHHLGPQNYSSFAKATEDRQSAAMFNTDNTVKTFVELEAGGKDAFVAMMDEKLYMPYTWQVRHVKEHETNETTIIFTPDGKPYGFVEKISENIPGAQLTEAKAQSIAEHDAATHWDIDFSQYNLVEASQKTEPSGRIDHTFIYERQNKQIGEGLYRLKIVVSGDKMTTVHHFVRVPEAFNRRYAEMRSANNSIAWLATILMGLLYILLGCGFGLLYLIRHRWNIIKQPVQWALFLAALATLVSLNQLPFLWMYYQSALSASGFLTQLLLGQLIKFFAYAAFLAIVIMTAEGLTRRAFGHQPQLWSLLQSDVAASYAIFGRTFGGYLLVGFNCAFVIAFYFFSSRYLGWWSPSETLFDPNILATYVPWFSPIAQSLNAGFMEECLFRAIPLAGAALLGNYFGRRNWWITAAFILQAVVFGAAHANYPVQPSYARLVELLIPSFIWGAIYLRFGLITTIISHFVYDVIWFSIPIFVAQTPHAFAYKMTIICITLLPLLYYFYARIKIGAWKVLPASALNASWKPIETSQEKNEPIVENTKSHNLSTTVQKAIIGLGIAGLIAWIYVTPFTHDGVIITLNRNEAVNIANNFVTEKNFTEDTSDFAKASSDKPWKILPLIFAQYNQVPQIALQHKFIWQEGNKELYHTLLGNYLHPAHWTVRYAQFDGNIIQRAEEYKIMLYNEHPWQCYHQLPESTAGAELTQHKARAIALATIQEQFNLTPEKITGISAQSSQLPHRKDWTFIFADPAAYPLQTGQARISVKIAGNEVVDSVRFIHVPEEWERAEQHKQNMLMNFMIIFVLIFICLLLCIVYFVYKQNKLFMLSQRLFFMLFGITCIIFCIDSINGWQTIVGTFNTSAPLNNQLFQSITGLIIGVLLKSIFYAGIISYVISHKKSHQLPNNWLTVTIGICTGLCVAGIYGIIQSVVPTNMPLWPHYESLGYALPLLADVTHAISHYMQLTIAFSMLFILVDPSTSSGRAGGKHSILLAGFAALCGMLMIHLSSLDVIGMWIIGGALFGWILLAIYRYIIRYDYALIAVATGNFTILQIIQQGMFNAYPSAMINAIISACAVSIISALIFKQSIKNSF
jgi:Type II CAAX prenyl endopeptidase Rce1-like